MTTADHVYEAEGYADDDLAGADIVTWYEARPMTVSAAAAVGSMVGAFALGALVAVGALALMGHFDD